MLFYYSKGTLFEEFVYRTHINLIDYLFLFPFWIGLIIVVEALPYFLASDLVQIITKLFSAKFKDGARKWLAIFKLLVFIFFVFYVTANSLLDTYSIKETKFNIKIDNLPDELNNTDLTLIADIQIDRFTQDFKIDGIKQLINEDQPDLLFFAGDLVTRGTYFINQGIDVMCDLQANLERVACIGDHDYWSDAENIPDGLQKCGWIFLNNEHRIINKNDAKILVTGITYVYSKRISLIQLSHLLKNVPDADLKILLVHQPSRMIIKAAEEYGYDILLAGHTHGGQVVFKPFGFTITPTKFENDYYSGYYKRNRLNIFVTNGVGLTMMPIRFRAPAEVMKIILRK